MKRVASLILFVGCFAPSASAQQDDNEHVQASVFADYFHLSQTSTHFARTRRAPWFSGVPEN